MRLCLITKKCKDIWNFRCLYSKCLWNNSFTYNLGKTLVKHLLKTEMSQFMAQYSICASLTLNSKVKFDVLSWFHTHLKWLVSLYKYFEILVFLHQAVFPSPTHSFLLLWLPYTYPTLFRVIDVWGFPLFYFILLSQPGRWNISRSSILKQENDIEGQMKE